MERQGECCGGARRLRIRHPLRQTDSFSPLSRSEFATTLTLERPIAAAAKAEFGAEGKGPGVRPPGLVSDPKPLRLE